MFWIHSPEWSTIAFKKISAFCTSALLMLKNTKQKKRIKNSIFFIKTSNFMLSEYFFKYFNRSLICCLLLFSSCQRTIKEPLPERQLCRLFLEHLMIREGGLYTLLGSKPMTEFEINEGFPET